MTRRRLVLLAMSGVRIQNAELLNLGLTLPGFVERGKVIASLPSLGLLTIAAYSPPHWEIEYLDFDGGDPVATVQSIAATSPDIVAISFLTARAYDAYEIADLLKLEGVAVVLGGLHASVMPHEAAKHADSVIVGEGEPVWSTVLSDYESGQLQKFYTPDPAKAFSECAPIPRYDLLDITKYNRITLQTSRGCPLDCSFCGASRLISPYKRKAPDAVRRELQSISAIWPRPFIELADDNSFVHKKWSLEMVNVIKEFRVRWFTETDISVADDEHLLEAMAESGCAQVLIGMEATTSDELSETDTHGWKKRRLPNYLEAIEKIQSFGISVNGCFVVGFDTSGPDVFERTRNFVRHSGLTEVQVTVMTPFPGTALYKKLKSQGRLINPSNWGACTLFDINFQPAKMTVDELQEGFKWLISELYSERETAKRRSLHRSLVRQRLSYA